jgi:Terpene cyclase DEP1
MQRTVLTLTLIAFGALSAIALWQHGWWGIIEPHFQTFGAAQVFADLVIALSLFLVWMWRDARANGRNPWPWLLLTLVSGSIGALLYLLLRHPRDTSALPATRALRPEPR